MHSFSKETFPPTVEAPGTSFHIGSLPVRGDLVLAPMDGITDSPFRQIARRFGSALSYTEFINAIDIKQKHPSLAKRLSFAEEERPLVFQLLDNNPGRIERAADFVMQYQPDVIDINLGCCSKNVAGRGAGAGLLREPQTIVQIFSNLSRLGLPLTAKIRLGWDDDSLNYLDIARLLEQNGCKLIAVHGRTRQQFYSGNADWDAIARVKEAVKIPVIGNGDVKSIEDIERLKSHTQCDGIMIGRAAIGNPWIFSRVDRHSLKPRQVFNTILDHLNRMAAFYGDPRGLILFRKHANAYIKPMEVPEELRRDLLTCLSREVFIQTLERIFSRATS